MIDWCFNGNLVAGMWSGYPLNRRRAELLTVLGQQAAQTIDTGHTLVNCRAGCGACCIAPSISSPIPGRFEDRSTGMPHGKPAGVRCVQLDRDNRCLIFSDPRRPAVCSSLRASVEMCGESENPIATHAHAMIFLSTLERLTRQ